MGEGETPEPVDAADGADEVAVAHVGQGAEVGLVPALLADAAAGPDPVARLLLLGGAVLARDLDAVGLEGRAEPAAGAAKLLVVVVRRGRHALGHRGRMPHLRSPAATFLGEGHGHGEDGLAPLARLHGPRAEGTALSHPLHVVQNGRGAIAGQDKIAVVGMYYKVCWHGTLRCLEGSGEVS